MNVKLRDHFDDEPEIKVRAIENPFRMAKLNLLWTKARAKLSEPKLKSLYTDLKIHDSEEVSLKHLKTTAGDKDGLKEAEIRKKLIGIMSTYDLLSHFEDMDDVKKHKDYDINPHVDYDRIVFKDKKLNKLWIKAEKAGFNKIELQVLKEEFSHHQDKVDQYNTLVKEVDVERRNTAENTVDQDSELFNEIELTEEDKTAAYYTKKANDIRVKSRDVKDGYDRLERLTAQGPNSKEFVEPKVQELWRTAANGNFTMAELESLRTELHHYEKRLMKLRHLHMEAAIGKANEGKKLAGEKIMSTEDVQNLIKKQARKVDKLHLDLESRISSRSEL